MFEPSGSKVTKSWSISSRVHCNFRLIIARRNSFGEIMPSPLRSHSRNKSMTRVMFAASIPTSRAETSSSATSPIAP